MSTLSEYIPKKGLSGLGRGSERSFRISNMRTNRVFKIIAMFVLVIFAHQQIVWAQGGESLWAAVSNIGKETSPVQVSGLDIKVPYSSGKMDQVYSNGGDKVVINIQDAHASLSAQYSVVELLDTLVADYDLNLIAVEGAKGYLDTSVLRSLPDSSVREKAADYFLREGRMNACEFFDITRDNENVALYGIETDELYRENLEGFRKVASEQAENIENINSFIKQIKALDKKIYSDDLRLLNNNAVLHKSGEISFSDYWNAIKNVSQKLDIDIREYKELSRLIDVIELEKSIDFDQANIERRVLIEELNGRIEKRELEALVLKTVAFKEDKISKSDFHTFLVRLAEANDISPESYRNLITFTLYITRYEGMNVFGLYHEIVLLEDAIREKLYRNDDERELYKIAALTYMLKRLYSMELTNGDSGFIRAHREGYDAAKFAEFIKDKCQKYGVEINGGYDITDMIAGIDEAMDFYDVAESRDRAMLENTILRMDKENKKVAALVTGGYHTEGLTKLMKEKGLSYLVIVPKFNKGEERPYVAVLTSKKRPYQKLLESGQYQLAVEAYFNHLDVSKIREIVYIAFGEARMGGKDVEEMKALWAEQYHKRYNALKANRERWNSMDVKPMSPEDFDGMLDVEVRMSNGEAVIVEADKAVAVVKRDGDRLDISSPAPRHERGDADMKQLLDEEYGVGDSSREYAIAKFFEPGIVDMIAGQLISNKKVSDKDVLKKLKAKGLPADWERDEELSATVKVIVAEVLIKVFEASEHRIMSKNAGDDAKRQAPSAEQIGVPQMGKRAQVEDVEEQTTDHGPQTTIKAKGDRQKAKEDPVKGFGDLTLADPAGFETTHQYRRWYLKGWSQFFGIMTKIKKIFWLGAILAILLPNISPGAEIAPQQGVSNEPVAADAGGYETQGETTTYYMVGWGGIESRTLDPADEYGNVYYHHLNEYAPQGAGRVDAIVRGEADEDGAIGYRYEYMTPAPTNVPVGDGSVQVIDGVRHLFVGFDVGGYGSIADAVTNSRPGDNVIVAQGIYDLEGEGIEVKSGVKIFGGYDQAGARDLDANLSIVSNGFFKVFNTTQPTEINGFTIDNSASRLQRCIYTAGSSRNLLIINNTLISKKDVGSAYGIVVTDSSQAVIYNNEIRGVSTNSPGFRAGGIYVVDGSDPLIANNKIHDVVGPAVTLAINRGELPSAEIINNVMWNNGGHSGSFAKAHMFLMYADGVVVENNTVYGGADGIVSGPDCSGTVANNVFNALSGKPVSGSGQVAESGNVADPAIDPENGQYSSSVPGAGYSEDMVLVEYEEEGYRKYLYAEADYSDPSNPVLSGLVAIQVYDADDNLVKTTLADGTVYEYDSDGRLIKETAPDGSYKTFVYYEGTSLMETVTQWEYFIELDGTPINNFVAVVRYDYYESGNLKSSWTRKDEYGIPSIYLRVTSTYFDEDFYGDQIGRLQEYRWQWGSHDEIRETYEYWMGTDTVRHMNRYKYPQMNGDNWYYANGDLEAAVLSVSDFVRYTHYMPDGSGRPDIFVNGFADDDGASAYEYEYFEGTNSVSLKRCYQSADYADPANPVLTGLLVVYEYSESGDVIRKTLSNGDIYEYDPATGRIILNYDLSETDYKAYQYGATQVRVEVYDGTYDPVSGVNAAERTDRFVYDHINELENLDADPSSPTYNGWIMREHIVYDTDGVSISERYEYDANGRMTVSESAISDSDGARAYEYDYFAGTNTVSEKRGYSDQARTDHVVTYRYHASGNVSQKVRSNGEAATYHDVPGFKIERYWAADGRSIMRWATPGDYDANRKDWYLYTNDAEQHWYEVYTYWPNGNIKYKDEHVWGGVNYQWWRTGSWNEDGSWNSWLTQPMRLLPQTGGRPGLSLLVNLEPFKGRLAGLNKWFKGMTRVLAIGSTPFHELGHIWADDRGKGIKEQDLKGILFEGHVKVERRHAREMGGIMGNLMAAFVAGVFLLSELNTPLMSSVFTYFLAVNLLSASVEVTGKFFGKGDLVQEVPVTPETLPMGRRAKLVGMITDKIKPQYMGLLPAVVVLALMCVSCEEGTHEIRTVDAPDQTSVDESGSFTYNEFYRDGELFILQTAGDGIPELLRSLSPEDRDLTGQKVIVQFRPGTTGRIQVGVKCRDGNIYSRLLYPDRNGVVSFDPSRDAAEVRETGDITDVYSVLAKIWEGSPDDIESIEVVPVARGGNLLISPMTIMAGISALALIGLVNMPAMLATIGIGAGIFALYKIAKVKNTPAGIMATLAVLAAICTSCEDSGTEVYEELLEEQADDSAELAEMTNPSPYQMTYYRDDFKGELIVQSSGDGLLEVYKDYWGDITGRHIVVKFRPGSFVEVQVGVKSRNGRSLYSKKLTPDENGVIVFNPAADPVSVIQFSDLTQIAGVVVKMWIGNPDNLESVNVYPISSEGNIAISPVTVLGGLSALALIGLVNIPAMLATIGIGAGVFALYKIANKKAALGERNVGVMAMLIALALTCISCGDIDETQGGESQSSEISTVNTITEEEWEESYAPRDDSYFTYIVRDDAHYTNEKIGINDNEIAVNGNSVTYTFNRETGAIRERNTAPQLSGTYIPGDTRYEGLLGTMIWICNRAIEVSNEDEVKQGIADIRDTLNREVQGFEWALIIGEGWEMPREDDAYFTYIVRDDAYYTNEKIGIHDDEITVNGNSVTFAFNRETGAIRERNTAPQLSGTYIPGDTRYEGLLGTMIWICNRAIEVSNEDEVDQGITDIRDTLNAETQVFMTEEEYEVRDDEYYTWERAGISYQEITIYGNAVTYIFNRQTGTIEKQDTAPQLSGTYMPGDTRYEGLLATMIWICNRAIEVSNEDEVKQGIADIRDILNEEVQGFMALNTFEGQSDESEVREEQAQIDGAVLDEDLAKTLEALAEAEYFEEQAQLSRDKNEITAATDNDDNLREELRVAEEALAGHIEYGKTVTSRSQSKAYYGSLGKLKKKVSELQDELKKALEENEYWAEQAQLSGEQDEIAAATVGVEIYDAEKAKKLKEIEKHIEEIEAWEKQVQRDKEELDASQAENQYWLEQAQLGGDKDELDDAEASNMRTGIIDGFVLSMGISAKVYNALSEDNVVELCSRTGIQRLVPILSDNPGEMISELNKATMGEKGLSALIDPSATEEILVMLKMGKADVLQLLGTLEPIMRDFAVKAEKDIVRLMNPEKANITTEELLQKIRKEGVDINEYNSILSVHARILPEMESLELADKSIFDMRINNLNTKILATFVLSGGAMAMLQDISALPLAEVTMEKAPAADAQPLINDVEKNEKRYVSVSARNLAEMRCIGEGIRRMGLDKERASAFIQVRVTDSNVTEENLDRFLEDTGLGLYLERKNVVIVDLDGMTLEKTLEKARETFGDVGYDQIAIGASENLITDGEEAILKGEKAPVYVQMDGPGIASQLLYATIEILANGSQIPAALGKISVRDGFKTWFVFLPNMKAVNIDELRKEIDNYERVLIAA